MKTWTNELGQPVGRPLGDWRIPPAPPRSPLAGRYCRLEPLAGEHSADLYRAFAAAADAGDWTYLPYGPFADPDAFDVWLKAESGRDDPLFFTIFDARDGRPAGLASYLRITPAAGSIEVGHIHYAPALQRTPAATEAMYLMMRRVFDELGYRRYEWKCDALNTRSRRAALRLGFRFEGEFRQATVYKDRNRDTAWFSVVDHEWPVLNAAFTAWLDPDNFDDQGRQRRRLDTLHGDGALRGDGETASP